MADTKFIPGFETASAHNRLLLVADNPDLSSIEFVGPGRCPYSSRLAEGELRRKHAFASHIGDVALESFVDSETKSPESWSVFNGQVSELVERYVDALDLDSYMALAPVWSSPVEAARHTKTAAREGVATITAFLEVIGRVAAHQELEKPDLELASMARSSLGFIVEWLGLDEEVDYRLAYALAKPKPSSINLVYEDLRFNSKWFILDQDGRVRINPDRAVNLRDHRHKHPMNDDRFQNGEYVLFGCPARRIIPNIYRSMINTAQEAGLLSQSYWTERANLGYLVEG
jgi:hypothetical protein